MATKVHNDKFEVNLVSSFDENQIYNFQIRRTNSFWINLKIAKYPTGNCQLCSLSTIANFQTVSTDKDSVKAILTECFKQMYIPHQWIPRLILVDVRAEHRAFVENCFVINSKTSYTSTNGSQMCLYILDWQKTLTPSSLTVQ